MNELRHNDYICSCDCCHTVIIASDEQYIINNQQSCICSKCAEQLFQGELYQTA